MHGILSDNNNGLIFLFCNLKPQLKRIASNSFLEVGHIVYMHAEFGGNESTTEHTANNIVIVL